jgi:hypothetical protein
MTEKKVVKKVVAKAPQRSKKISNPAETWLKAYFELRHGGLAGEELAKAKLALAELEIELLKQL